jgi:hypothetical protein
MKKETRPKTIKFLALLLTLYVLVTAFSSIGEEKQTSTEEVVDRLLALDPSGYPSLGEEELGMLHWMYRRALAPINDTSGFDSLRRPFAAFGADVRYDYTFSSHAVAMAAERTPAYREIYQYTIDSFIQRLIDKQSWWDWTEGLSGNDGSVIPYSPDPIAPANIMYSGYFNTVLGLYELVTNDHRYDDDFTLAYNDTLRFTYNHTSITEAIYRQMRENRYGCYGVPCETHSVFYICNMLGSSGLRLYDEAHETDYAEVVEDWLGWVGDNFIVPPRSAGLPIAFVHSLYRWKDGIFIPIPIPEANLLEAAYTSPFDASLAGDVYRYTKLLYGRYCLDGTAYFTQSVSLANWLWKYMGFGAVEFIMNIASRILERTNAESGYDVPFILVADAEATIAGLLAAKAVGDLGMYDRVLAYIDRNYQPAWDNGTLHYGLYYSNGSGFNNGMANGLIMLARVMPANGLYGVWNGGIDERRFSEPALCGVDCDNVRVSTAFFDRDNSALILGLDASQETSFTIANLDTDSDVVVIEDGGLKGIFTSDNKGEIRLSASEGRHSYAISQIHHPSPALYHSLALAPRHALIDGSADVIAVLKGSALDLTEHQRSC